MKKLTTVILLLLTTLTVAAEEKYVGGDISLLPSYEASNAKYHTHDGTEISSVLTYLGSEKWNAMRVRIFVDPDNASSDAKGEGVKQDYDYILPLCKQIKEAGFKLMLDFHYSDTWADPSKQWTPKDWEGVNDNTADLSDSLYNYTVKILNGLKSEGCAPDMIQIGNEISYGMLWGAEDASTLYKVESWIEGSSTWTRFLSLLTKASTACRDVLPEAKIIIHSERVAEPANLKIFYNKMADIDYDIIGLSYYPYFHGALSVAETAIKTLEENFADKDIMIVETGYPYAYEIKGSTYDLTSTWAYSDAGQNSFMEDLITMLNKHDKVTGLFWWFPEANEYGNDWATQRVTENWYNASLVDNNTGRFGSATSTMKKFLGSNTSIQESIENVTDAVNKEVYRLDGTVRDKVGKGVNIVKETYGKLNKKLKSIKKVIVEE